MDRQFLHCTGANATFASADVPDAALSGARLMHFGYPTAMRRMWADGGAETEALLRRAKDAGLTTSLDITMPDPSAEAGGADWAAFFRRVAPYADLLTPSFEETLFVLDRQRFRCLQARAGEGHVAAGADGPLLSALGAQLVELGAAVVMITLVSEGLYLRTTADASRLAAMGRGAPADPKAWRRRELLVPCFDVAVAGTTGAGDSCAAGLLTGLLRGLGPEEAATGAAAVGAACVERPDATSGIRAWDEIRGRVDAGWARRPVALPLDGWTWDAGHAVCHGPNDGASP
jgi:sugar/nucleoside kinase (ribokinase family)